MTTVEPVPGVRPGGGALPEGVRETLLDNGVRVVTERMPDVRSVAVGYWVAIGSRDEDDDVAGASHFLEHLLFKGTERRDALEIAEVMDEVGGDMNAVTSKEYTCFYARCLDRDLARATDVLGDLISAATITAEDVDAERQVVLEEIRMHLDTPDDLVHSDFAQAWYGRHPLGREVLGSGESITGMPADDVRAYYRRHYVPGNLTVALAGNLEHDAAVELVAASLRGITPMPQATAVREAPLQGPTERLVLRERPGEQVHVVLGGRGLSRAHDLRFAGAVLNHVVGGGMSSRLFQEIREQRGLSYSVYSYADAHVDGGSYAVYCGTAPRNVEEVLDLIREELADVRAHGIDADELERAKGAVAGSTVLALEDSGSRMTRLGKSYATRTPLLSLDEVLAAVERVTLEDVAAAAELLLEGPFTLAVVGPAGELGLDREQLAAYTAAS